MSLKQVSSVAYAIAALISAFLVNCNDLDITTFAMIRQEGYPAEEHEIVTDDGYVLSVERIPGSKKSTPVFLQHGFLSSSFDWVVTGKNKGLAFILADHGYDVWIGNGRGTTYSRKHKHYTTSDIRYWNFSWHEMGTHDLPAVITYITDLKQDKLIYIGHSMGTTVSYVMAIERPDIGSKVKAIFSLAPSAFMYHTRSPSRFVVPLAPEIDNLSKSLGLGELLPQSIVLKFISDYTCGINLSESNVCVQMMFASIGYDASQFNYTLLPLILHHAPAGSSVKTLQHYIQIVKTGRFQYYDYGPTGNLKMYNHYEPPDYDVTKIQVPTAVFWSDNDFYATRLDVKKLYDLLPKKIISYRIPYSKFNHVDFIWAIDAPKLVYAKLLSLMEDYR